MRARGRVPNTAVNRSALVAMRRSVIVPSSAVIDRGLARLCRSRPIISMAVGRPVCAPSAIRSGDAAAEPMYDELVEMMYKHSR